MWWAPIARTRSDVGGFQVVAARLDPCVGSASCAMSEIVLDHRSGRLVKPGDVDHLASVLVDLLGGDPARLRAMGEEGRVHARGRFPWPMVAGRIDEGLRRVLAKSRGAAARSAAG
jgi:glycosyltransferase involved in cell wall biosynthesis